MTRRPRTILPGTIVDDALPLFGLHKITALFVVDDLDRPKPLGLLHIHDLPRGRATG
jgi:arabinose-5-phosphate isomerase